MSTLEKYRQRQRRDQSHQTLTRSVPAPAPAAAQAILAGDWKLIRGTQLFDGYYPPCNASGCAHIPAPDAGAALFLFNLTKGGSTVTPDAGLESPAASAPTLRVASENDRFERQQPPCPRVCVFACTPAAGALASSLMPARRDVPCAPCNRRRPHRTRQRGSRAARCGGCHGGTVERAHCRRVRPATKQQVPRRRTPAVPRRCLGPLVVRKSTRSSPFLDRCSSIWFAAEINRHKQATPKPHAHTRAPAPRRAADQSPMTA